ncbi:hypothetical protein KKE33_04285 [Patescibacteria group bacterium]|nr:hypothetical protein [Patescibacteria group bacterium]
MGEENKCSFCGKKQDEVTKLIAGPNIFICDWCIGICNDVIATNSSQTIGEPGDVQMPPCPDLIANMMLFDFVSEDSLDMNISYLWTIFGKALEKAKADTKYDEEIHNAQMELARLYATKFDLELVDLMIGNKTVLPFSAGAGQILVRNDVFPYEDVDDSSAVFIAMAEPDVGLMSSIKADHDSDCRVCFVVAPRWQIRQRIAEQAAKQEVEVEEAKVRT